MKTRLDIINELKDLLKENHCRTHYENRIREIENEYGIKPEIIISKKTGHRILSI